MPDGDSWAAYRRLRRLFAFSLLGYVPVVGTLAAVVTLLRLPEWLVAIVAIHWMGFFLVRAAWLAAFPCPRCGEPFYHPFAIRNLLAPRCPNCGLRKWEQPARPTNPTEALPGPTQVA